MPLPEWLRRRNELPGAEARPILQTLKSTIAGIGRVPTLPVAATRAMIVAKNPDSSLAELSAIIERDPALAADVLKLANSALFRRGSGDSNLHQAVVRLGMRECQNLILAVGMRSLFRSVPPARQEAFEALWQHSFLTACLCRRLDQALGLNLKGDEFASGLAHDIGRVVLALGSPEHAAAADPLDFDEGPEILLREHAVLGTDHCHFGAWFANMNNLPGALISAVQFHHTPESAQHHRPLVALVAVADHMANYYQRQQQVEGYEAAANPSWPVLQTHVTGRRDLADLAADLFAEAVEEAQHAAGGAVVKAKAEG
jgi:HD-like signal output (HDOD) protein